MEILKTLLKMIGGLLAGALIGLVVAGIGLICFTDLTFPEYIEKLKNVPLSEGSMVALTAMVAFVVFEILLVIIHEAGHLVCGLRSGYKFVSFRMMNLTFIRVDGKIRIKRYSIAGTGGQCLLLPPDGDPADIPVTLYNFGGILANLICLILALPIFLIPDLPPLATTTVWVFILADLLLLILNGIPFQFAGLSNDMSNIILLRKDPLSRRGFISQLRANALIQDGIRPKDMPEEIFEIPENLNYRDPLQACVRIMYASRLADMLEYEKALAEFELIYSHKEELMGLFVKEIESELACLRMMTGDIDGARKLLDNKDLMKYINTYRKVMSSKERTLCAKALYLDADPEKAIAIYRNLDSRKDAYLMQGEVASDLTLIRDMLLREGLLSANQQTQPAETVGKESYCQSS